MGLNLEGTMPEVTVYSTPTCPYCHQAKEYLDSKGVAYNDVDVATDLQGRKQMINDSGQMGVPVIEIDKHIIVGFDKEEIDKYLS